MAPVTTKSMCLNRAERLKNALFRGANLRIDNLAYLGSVRAITQELVNSDIGPADLTTEALGFTNDLAAGRVIAKARGIVAGIAEFSWLLSHDGIRVRPQKSDGEAVDCGDVVLEIEGQRRDLLTHERVALNLLQRMSGIATMTWNCQKRVQERSPGTWVVGTRKTPWGILDKRALHLGGGGTHRLGLWDAILVKNNHLAWFGGHEEQAVCVAARRAWEHRRGAAFIEIEVRSQQSAIAAATTFRELQQDTARNQTQTDELPPCPCLLLLDNMVPEQVHRIVDALRSGNLLDHMLIEASGSISEGNLSEYAESGADAISMGVLTHSVPAFDFSQQLS